MFTEDVPLAVLLVLVLLVPEFDDIAVNADEVHLKIYWQLIGVKTI